MQLMRGIEHDIHRRPSRSVMLSTTFASQMSELFHSEGLSPAMRASAERSIDACR